MSWIVLLNSFFKFWISIKNFKNSLSNIFSFFKNTVALFQKNIEKNLKVFVITLKAYLSQLLLSPQVKC